MKPDRRLRRIVSLVTVAALGVIACANPTGPTPKVGGRLIVGSWQEPDSLLQAGITADVLYHVYADVNPVMEGLLRAKAPEDVTALRTGTGVGVIDVSAARPINYPDYWEPQLATEVPTVENGDVNVVGTKMDVTWKLRKGVRWQDGERFGSADVKATFDFWWLKFRDKNPTKVAAVTGWDRVDSVDTPDDHTAIVHFKQVYGPYLTLGSGPYGILPAHLLQKTWDKGGDMSKVKLNIDLSPAGGYKGTDTWDNWMVGTGPFMFKEWVKGDHLTLVRNPNWWGPHAAYLDTITVNFEPDPSTELSDLKANTIDFGWDFRDALVAPVTHVQNVTVLNLPDSGVEKLDLNLKNPFLSDIAVRRAILAGIDRQTIVETLLTGKTVVPADSWLCLPNSSGAWCHDDNLKLTKFDRAAARRLLEQAGYKRLSSGDSIGYYSKNGKDPIALNLLTTSGNTVREQEQLLIANDLKMIGIKVNTPFTNPKPGRLLSDYAGGGVLYNHAFDMALYTNTYLASTPGEPDSLAFGSYRCDQIPGTDNGGRGQNSTQVCDKDLDAALERGRTGPLRQADRKQAYVDAQEILSALLPEIPLYQQVTVMAYNTKMRGYKGNDFFWMNSMEDVYLS